VCRMSGVENLVNIFPWSLDTSSLPRHLLLDPCHFTSSISSGRQVFSNHGSSGPQRRKIAFQLCREQSAPSWTHGLRRARAEPDIDRRVEVDDDACVWLPMLGNCASVWSIERVWLSYTTSDQKFFAGMLGGR